MNATRPFAQALAGVPRLGFGVSGPHGFSLTPPALTQRLIEQAYGLGLRLFDSAPFYGQAEGRLGQTLQALDARDALVVSKVGTVRTGGRLIKDFTPAGLHAQVRQALDNLRRDRIDLLLLHGPPLEPLPQAFFAALAALHSDGLVGAFGVAGRGAEIAAQAAHPLLEVVQAPVWSPWPAWCAERGKLFLGIEALARLNRRRGWFPRDAAGAWLLARRLQRMAASPSAPVAGPDGAPAEILRAALAQTGVSAVLMTTTRLEHLRANIAALSA